MESWLSTYINTISEVVKRQKTVKEIQTDLGKVGEVSRSYLEQRIWWLQEEIATFLTEYNITADQFFEELKLLAELKKGLSSLKIDIEKAQVKIANLSILTWWTSDILGKINKIVSRRWVEKLNEETVEQLFAVLPELEDGNLLMQYKILTEEEEWRLITSSIEAFNKKLASEKNDYQKGAFLGEHKQLTDVLKKADYYMTFNDNLREIRVSKARKFEHVHERECAWSKWLWSLEWNTFVLLTDNVFHSLIHLWNWIYWVQKDEHWPWALLDSTWKQLTPFLYKKITRASMNWWVAKWYIETAYSDYRDFLERWIVGRNASYQFEIDISDPEHMWRILSKSSSELVHDNTLKKIAITKRLVAWNVDNDTLLSDLILHRAAIYRLKNIGIEKIGDIEGKSNEIKKLPETYQHMLKRVFDDASNLQRVA